MCIGIHVWWAPCRRPGGLGSGQEEDWRHIFLSELPEFFSLLLFNGSLTTIQRCTHQNCSTQYLFFFKANLPLGPAPRSRNRKQNIPGPQEPVSFAQHTVCGIHPRCWAYRHCVPFQRCDIPLDAYPTVVYSLSSWWTLELVPVFFFFPQLWIKPLSAFPWRVLCGHKFSCLWGKYLRWGRWVV